jgi:hypothetical protein
MFTGLVEVVAAVLLFVPGLTLLGALVALLATSFVFVTNMTYDIGVKLFSFHLVLMSLVLIAPDWRRLASVLVLNRTTPARVEGKLLRVQWRNRAVVLAQLILAVAILWTNFNDNFDEYRLRSTAKPPLGGIWNVETMTVDGQLRPPLLTDSDRFRRFIVQGCGPCVFPFSGWMTLSSTTPRG